MPGTICIYMNQDRVKILVCVWTKAVVWLQRFMKDTRPYVGGGDPFVTLILFIIK